MNHVDISVGDEVMCEPFPKEASGTFQVTNQFGLKEFGNLTMLVPVKALSYGCGASPGDTVYISGKATVQDFAKNRWVIDGKQVMFVPKGYVKLVRRAYDQGPTGTAPNCEGKANCQSNAPSAS